MDYKKIGHRIELRRKELELTLADLAAEVDLSASTIQRYEKGRFDKIKMPIIEAIAEALCVNPDWLMCLTDDPTDYDDGNLLAEIPLFYVEACDGDMKRAYAMMKAVDDDYFREQTMPPAVSRHAPPLSNEAIQLALAYDKQLDTWGKLQVRTAMEQALARRADEMKALQKDNCIRLPLAIPSMGVGVAIQFSDSDFETILVEDNEYTRRAIFAVRVRDDTSDWGKNDIILFENSDNGGFGVFVIDGMSQLMMRMDDRIYPPGRERDAITLTSNIQCKGYAFRFLYPSWVIGNKPIFPDGYNGPKK